MVACYDRSLAVEPLRKSAASAYNNRGGMLREMKKGPFLPARAGAGEAGTMMLGVHSCVCVRRYRERYREREGGRGRERIYHGIGSSVRGVAPWTSEVLGPA